MGEVDMDESKGPARPPKGADSYIIAMDDAFTWTMIDGDDHIENGTFFGEWASFDEQVGFAKLYMVKRLGHDVQDSRLHVQNERQDRHDW
jgi:hypothetical protein